MTETKRKPGRPPGSKNKNSKTSSKTGKGTQGKPRAGTKAAAEAERLAAKKRLRDEIVSIVLIAVGVFLVVAFQTSAAGTIGTVLSQFFKGLFGFTAYILPYYFIVYGILLFTRKTIHVGVKSVILLLVIFLALSLMNAGRFIQADMMEIGLGNLAVHYNNGMILDDGGAFGMVAGGTIVKLIGIPGLYIFSFVVIIICLLLLMDSPVSRFFENIKAKKQQRAVEREERLRAKEAERAERQQQMEMDMLVSAHQPTPPPDMTEGQRKILGYMKEDSFEAGRRVVEEPEELDFSLGEDKEKPKKKRRSRKAAADMDTAGAAADQAAGAGAGDPVIVGGFSPKAMEDKLTKSEAAKSTLKDEDFNIQVTSGESYEFPPVSLLNKGKSNTRGLDDEKSLRIKAAKLEDTLQSFNIDAKVTNVTQGPAVTRYEVHPNSGVKVKGIKNLADDIALNMEAKSIRIEAPIPGKPAVGIEIENDRINMVTVREIIDSAAFR
ncbi:MAG: DNA translocase FtsK 4TM domain-containing protein, partial [Bacillota bacterium]|nr:DNA translocase FtsK 4TM domain-containing protein [Bacillota bacterium]